MGLFSRLFSKSEVNFKNITENKLDKYIEDNIDISKSKKWDYTSPTWGHSITSIKEINQNPLIHQITGFNSGGMIIGSSFIKMGDTMLLNTSGGVVAFLVLSLETVKDPSDMFHAYIVGVDTQPEKTK